MRAPALRRGKTVWVKTDAHPVRYATLRGHHETEIAIIGGGLTGAMLAEAFTNAGAAVIVVEAARVGHGSTAASTALLLQEPDQDLKALSKRYGAARARRIWQISRDAARDFVDGIHRLKIQCDLRELDSIYYTLDDDRVAELKRELKRRQGAKLGGTWLTPLALEQLTGIHGAGAIRTRGNAQLNPLAACIGFMRAAAKNGATIFERSTVTRIRPMNDRVRIYAKRGTIDAQQVVIATGYATRYFRPLAGRFKMRRTFVIASHPATQSQRRRIGLKNVMLWDTERPYHYVRWTDDHQLLLGGADHPVKPGANRRHQFAAGTQMLREYFETLYPALTEVGLETAWEGLFAMTPDSLPYIGPHRRYPRHTFALGYGGNGMTFAALAARILVEQWQEKVSADHDFFSFSRGD